MYYFQTDIDDLKRQNGILDQQGMALGFWRNYVPDIKYYYMYVAVSYRDWELMNSIVKAV